MYKRIKRIILLICGWGFVIAGIISIFLPFLQGVAFIITGLVLLGYARHVKMLLKNGKRNSEKIYSHAQKKVLIFFKQARVLDIILGCVFFGLGIAGIIIHFQQGVEQDLFWLSNHWALINGIAFLSGSSFIFSSVTVLGIIPELFWVVDFLFLLFTGHQLFGITNYWFAPEYSIVLKILNLQHIINPLAALYGVKRFGFHHKAWIGGIGYGIFIWLIGLLIIGRVYNVNCAWKNCILFLPIPDLVWQIAWPFVAIGLILVMCRILGKGSRKKKK